MFRIRLIIAICCCFHFLQIESQTPYAISLNRSAGLSSNVTYDIIQDSRGFIWIASNDGLVRYDGFEFKTFINSNQSSLAGSSIMEDKFGRIWYQNFDGNLSYVENNQLFNLLNTTTVDYFKQGIVGDKLYVRHQEGFEVFDLKNIKKTKINSIRVEF
jgi:ligand-binding sensor domain-containing protein